MAERVSEDYPGISWDGWYIDIMTAKLLDKARRSDFQVLVMPNLYGDILTDEAAEIQGGVGTAGSANIGTRYAMFEAIHGSAPRMVAEGRAKYADPSSVLKAAGLMLSHLGYGDLGKRVDMGARGVRSVRKTNADHRPKYRRDGRGVREVHTRNGPRPGLGTTMVRVRGCAVRKPADRVSSNECHSERSRRIYRPTDGKARPVIPRNSRLRERAGREVGLGMTKALRCALTRPADDRGQPGLSA